jgi:heptosyltransferase-2
MEERYTTERMAAQTLGVYEECLTKPRILVWKLSALGDVVLSSPSLRAVRKRYPAGQVSLIVGRSAYDLVAKCPYLDEIILYDPSKKDRGPAGHLALLRRLRRAEFDLSIDLQNSHLTHLLAWAAGIPVRAGYRRKLGELLNRPVDLPSEAIGPVAHQHYLLERIGCPPDDAHLELWPSAQDEAAAQRLLSPLSGDPRPLVGLHPGGSGRWKTKRWDLARWAQLCDRLAARGVRILVTGGPDERLIGEALTRLTAVPLRNVIGQTRLMELACLIKRCDVFVTHDSSPLHLAAAMGTPAVALFGPTDPQRHLPSRFVGQAIMQKVFCSPCYSPRCRTITHACMQGITVDRVTQAVFDLLPQPVAPASATETPSP